MLDRHSIPVLLLTASFDAHSSPCVYVWEAPAIMPILQMGIVIGAGQVQSCYG